MIDSDADKRPNAGRPDWIRAKAPSGENYEEVLALVNDLRLHTVCQSAGCPNIGECWRERTATFMILGNTCTRDCGFCAVPTGRPLPVDEFEPQRVAEAAAALSLRHVVITSVTRDDLPDGGAAVFAATIRAIRRNPSPALPETGRERGSNPSPTLPETGREQVGMPTIEVLIPDFQGSYEALRAVVEARPDVLNHNVETVPSMYPAIRPQADYRASLELLRRAKEIERDLRDEALRELTSLEGGKSDVLGRSRSIETPETTRFDPPLPNPLPPGERGLRSLQPETPENAQSDPPHPNPLPPGERGLRSPRPEILMLTKSGIMVGVGETMEEIQQTMRDLREVGCDILTIGQYLRPTLNHAPIRKYYTPEEFKQLRLLGIRLAFKHVEAGPLVRSSYHAEEAMGE